MGSILCPKSPEVVIEEPLIRKTIPKQENVLPDFGKMSDLMDSSSSSNEELFKKYLKAFQPQFVTFPYKNQTEFVFCNEDILSPFRKEERIQAEIKGMHGGSLPLVFSNSIFMLFNEQKIEFLKTFIAGSAGTPYAHGLFEFDVCLKNYPLEPPLVNIRTTGGGSVRFNPNLYSEGKVCLSLINTWAGAKEETWSPFRTLSQVMISIQGLVMDENITAKEPMFYSEGQSEKMSLQNIGYSNIVKYATIRFAMIDQIRNAPEWASDLILIYFYLKKNVILDECRSWLNNVTEKNDIYDGLVSLHNPKLAALMKNGNYSNLLKNVICDLEKEFEKLKLPVEKSLEDKTDQSED